MTVVSTSDADFLEQRVSRLEVVALASFPFGDCLASGRVGHLYGKGKSAVAAAYGWDWPLSDDEILRRLFELNQVRSAVQ